MPASRRGRQRNGPKPRIDASDERARFVLGWWQRMHSGRRPLVAIAIKPVAWRAGTETERYIWEVCKWPQRDGFVWHFICWSIDGVGAWWKAFPSKLLAMTHFRQAPGVVMAKSQPKPVATLVDGGIGHDGQYAAAS